MKVLVNGLGLIGGSLAYAFSKFAPDAFIVGLDRNPENLKQAQAKGIIHKIGRDLATEAPDADVILLATPVEVIQATIVQLAKLPLKKDVIVTDAGSTKQTILAAATPLVARQITFIGGHPMAGSHKSGIQAAHWDLFRSAFYLLVPAPGVAPAQIARLQRLLAVTQAKFLTIDAKQHDHVVALLSHVPHILAAGLVNLAHEDFKETPGFLRLAAGGFRDMTRIASSDPDMWADILDTNHAEILELLQAYGNEIQRLEWRIANQDRQALYDFFQQAKITRNKIETKKQSGALPGFFDLYINIEDRSGAIAAITSQLAQANISLVNIQVLETRDEITGILQVTFKNKADLQKAKTILKPTLLKDEVGVKG